MPNKIRIQKYIKNIIYRDQIGFIYEIQGCKPRYNICKPRNIINYISVFKNKIPQSSH